MSAAIDWRDEDRDHLVGLIDNWVCYRIEKGEAFARLTDDITGEYIEVAPLHQLDTLKDAAERHNDPR